ncbi:MAG: hypothetical protein JKY08_04500 [Flavobacteriaceae bacterium]|nr:hypothetical protein [Flavobacteriaceae bacterium]
MKRLFKIVILFLIIFAIGVVVAIDSIHNTFKDESIETVHASPKLLNAASQLF